MGVQTKFNVPSLIPLIDIILMIDCNDKGSLHTGAVSSVEADRYFKYRKLFFLTLLFDNYNIYLVIKSCNMSLTCILVHLFNAKILV